jgi:dihydrofolate synthase/folylpolyglutamate synthase
MASDAYSSYLEAVKYIESFLPASGSERWKLLLNLFGNPHESFRSVHVAGTSGKGSVALMIGEILRASGQRVGVHVKPYVQSATENIILDGKYISCRDYAGLIEKVKPVLAGLTPEEYSRFGPVTWSEVTKLLPLLSFAERKVDYGVVEAGVGGREDLTNVLRPEVSVITSVGLDHSDLLGGTIDIIAHQKAGVIKQGTPTITAVRQRGALEIISAEAELRSSKLHILGRDFKIRVTKVCLDGTEFDYRSKSRRLKKVSLRMVGRHQAVNAAVAITAADAIKGTGEIVDEGSIRAGLESARLPGRFELVQEKPPVILDVAHNAQKVGVLLDVLEDVFGKRKVTFVLGFIEGKDARRMVGLVAHKARHLVFTNPTVRGKKPIDIELLKSLAGKLTDVPSLVDPDPMSAIEKGLDLAGDKGIVCVTGSLYLVGKIRGKWFDVRKVAESRSSYPS